MTSPASRELTNDLMAKVTRLEPQEFDHFVADVLTLQAQRRSDTLVNAEAKLVEQISLGIMPSTWRRYDELKEKKRARTLTESEHAELISIGNQIERANASRMTALATLAAQRETSLDALMDEFGISAPEIEE